MWQWTPADDAAWRQFRPGVDALFTRWLDLVLEAIPQNPRVWTRIITRFHTPEGFRAHLAQHRATFMQTPQDPASRDAARQVGFAHIRANIDPSSYVGLYNLMFAAYHALEDQDPRVAMPPLPTVRRRWVADLEITLDTYSTVMHQNMAVLDTLATTDPLTGLLNRRGFQEAVERHLTAPVPKEGLFVLADLDHFKTVNDTHGHPEGDQLLQTGATLAQTFTRSTDLLSRLGGDEFAVWLPGLMSYTIFYEHMNTVAHAIEKATALTLSVGVARYPHDGTTFDALYTIADAALYRVKQAGRHGCTGAHQNQVHFFTHPPTQPLP